ncbi:hypothetical protein BX600DRAFT_433536 [Xylariales sp. PMI_506]|nr:hypothetical protein BX600DRAFT_433536 [Xylariales sp. PMI_506]
MERDSRRDRGLWRGCHTFQDRPVEGGQQNRRAGLQMGQTYYYFYEVDASVETFDPNKPTTNVCPYLPGQTVNTLEVPTERSSRSRSASTGSVDAADFKTLDPYDKFKPPKPPAKDTDIFDMYAGRIGVPLMLPERQKRNARSASPSPNWAKRLLGLRPASRDRARYMPVKDLEEARSAASSRTEEFRSPTPSDGYQSRNISAASIRRLLSDEAVAVDYAPRSTHRYYMPEDAVDDNEDDDNFANMSRAGSVLLTTLSPPPMQRSASPASIPDAITMPANIVVPEKPPRESAFVMVRNSLAPFRSQLEQPCLPPLPSIAASSIQSPTSPRSAASFDYSNYSFYDDSHDDDEDFVSVHELELESEQTPRVRGFRTSIQNNFSSYSLPRDLNNGLKSISHEDESSTLKSPELVARGENGLPMGNAALLTLDGIDTGLDDLMDEIDWIADVVRPFQS